MHFCCVRILLTQTMNTFYNPSCSLLFSATVSTAMTIANVWHRFAFALLRSGTVMLAAQREKNYFSTMYITCNRYEHIASGDDSVY